MCSLPLLHCATPLNPTSPTWTSLLNSLLASTCSTFTTQRCWSPRSELAVALVCHATTKFTFGCCGFVDPGLQLHKGLVHSDLWWNPSSHQEWRKRINIYHLKMKLQKRTIESVLNLIGSIQGTAWKLVEGFDMTKLSEEKSFDEVIALLVRMPQGFDAYFNLSRKPGTSLLSYVTEHDEKLRKIVEHGIKLPDQVQGWLLLRRANLTKEQNQLVLTQGSKLEKLKEHAVHHDRPQYRVGQRPFHRGKAYAAVDEDAYYEDSEFYAESYFEPMTTSTTTTPSWADEAFDGDAAYFQEDDEATEENAADLDFGGDTAPNVGQHGPHNWANLAPKRPPTLGGTWGRTLRSIGFRLFLQHFCFRLSFCSSSGVSSCMLGQHSLKPGPIAPRWLNLAPKMGQHSLKTGQHSPKMGQHLGPTSTHTLLSSPRVGRRPAVRRQPLNQSRSRCRWPSGLRLTASRGSTPPWSRARVGRGTQTKPQMQRPGHTGRKALAKKKINQSRSRSRVMKGLSDCTVDTLLFRSQGMLDHLPVFEEDVSLSRHWLHFLSAEEDMFGSTISLEVHRVRVAWSLGILVDELEIEVRWPWRKFKIEGLNEWEQVFSMAAKSDWPPVMSIEHHLVLSEVGHNAEVLHDGSAHVGVTRDDEAIHKDEWSPPKWRVLEVRPILTSSTL